MFQRFPRPSSGEQKLYVQHLVLLSFVAATASVVFDSNKEYCITLCLVGYN